MDNKRKRNYREVEKVIKKLLVDGKMRDVEVLVCPPKKAKGYESNVHRPNVGKLCNLGELPRGKEEKAA